MKLLKKNRRWTRARLHFWLFIDREVLEHFFALVKEGQFGVIRSARGHGQDRRGRPVSFSYDRGEFQFRWPDTTIEPEPGWVELTGRMTNADLVQIRNHTTFHLRMFYAPRHKA